MKTKPGIFDGSWQITGTPLAGLTSELCGDLIATGFLPYGKRGLQHATPDMVSAPR